MTPTPLRQPKDAFTLIEMLVVITIIIVLMGLAFPAFQGVQNAAKKTQAKNDLVQIVTAVNAFYTEYGKYPLPANSLGDGYTVGKNQGNGTTSSGIFDALRALDPVLNPRNVLFISPPDVKASAQPRSGIAPAPDGQFYDPWGNAYELTTDADYDNQVPNPYGANGGAGPAEIRQSVIAWSRGKNGALGGGDAAANSAFSKESGSANQYTGSGDVISWQ